MAVGSWQVHPGVVHPVFLDFRNIFWPGATPGMCVAGWAGPTLRSAFMPERPSPPIAKPTGSGPLIPAAAVPTGHQPRPQHQPPPSGFSTDCALGSTNCFLYMASWQNFRLPAASSPPWRSPSCGALQKGGFFTFLLLLNPKATKAGVSRTELDPAKNPCS